MNRFHFISAAALLMLALLVPACQEHVADNPTAGKPPQTFLWLFPDAEVRVGVSRTHLRWWGESPDGLIRGYLFSFKVVTENVTTLPSPDTLRYAWVTRNDSTFLFPLDTLFRRFAVVVRAVDDAFPGLPEHSSVRMLPFPFWDKNDNGVFDAADERLDALSQAVDPTGAVGTFPIRNTPPFIGMLPSPYDPSLVQRLPDTTFTVVTLGFKGSDDDGDNTLASYRIALNDTGGTAQWVTVGLRDTILTLVVPRLRSDAAGATVTADLYSGSFLGRRLIGQVPNLRLDAENVFYVEARDVAGEYSAPVRLPSGTDRWYVRRPRAKVLLVSDYTSFDAQLARTTYVSSLTSASGGSFGQVDQLDIALGLAAADKEAGRYGRLVPQFVDPALIQTFLLYDYVVWYTDQVPSLGIAQLSVFPYLQNGGRVIFSTMFLNTTDPRGALRDFAPIDSISTVDLSPTRPAPPPAVEGDSRVPANFIVYADSSVPGTIYPQLAFNASPVIHSVFMRTVYRRSDSRYLYHLQVDTRTPQRYLGAPNIAVIDGQNSIIFVGLPLHLLNNTVQGNPLGLSAFFGKALTQFSPGQVVNRFRF
ncbi:MAG TPA: hypothetical protein VLT13_04060 [Bacteroidota bacterium]|nr:hypothetical protein [Bacteroidota bacterium]